MRVIKWLIFGLTLFVINACTTAYYKTESDGVVNKNAPIFITTGAKVEGVEEKRFKRMLETSLKNKGYQVAPKASGNCILLFSLTEPTYNNIGSYTTYSTQTSNTQTSGFVGNTYVSGTSITTTRTPQTHTYSYQTTYKKIYATLGCPSSNTYDLIWDGFMSAEIDDYNSYKENAVANFVDLMDYDSFKGKLRIDTTKHLAHLQKYRKRRHWLTLSGDVAYVSLASVNVSNLPPRYSFETSSDEHFLSLATPINLRLGYAFDTKYVTLGLNALYTANFVYGYDGYGYQHNTFMSNRFGAEATMIIADHLLIGFGVAKDLGASIQITDDKLASAIHQRIDAIYGLWRVGWLYHIPATNFYLTTELSGGWSITDSVVNATAANVLNGVFGLLYKI